MTPRDPPPEREDSDSSDDGPSKLELLARQLDALRQAGEAPRASGGPPDAWPILSSFDADGLAAYINDGNEQDIVVMGGAGMSTAEGIPDFRSSPGTGLYDNLQKYDLPHPRPSSSWPTSERRPEASTPGQGLWPGTYCPTTTHLFIKLLHDKGRLLRCFTQNIDSLESAAGVPAELTVAAHGNFDSATCMIPVHQCRSGRTQSGHRRGTPGLASSEIGKEGSSSRDIVFFGAGTRDHLTTVVGGFFFGARTDAGIYLRCKLLLVIGTSLSVQPFAQLVGHVPENCVVSRQSGRRGTEGPADPHRRGATFRVGQLGLRERGELSGRGFIRWRVTTGSGRSRRRLGWADDLDRLVASATALFAARAPPPPPELPPPRQLSRRSSRPLATVDDDDANAAPVVFE